jgi:hypothetical protein
MLVLCGGVASVVMVAGAGFVIMLGMGLRRRYHFGCFMMRAGSAGRLQRSGKPLQGQRGDQKPEQEGVEGAFHSGEYSSQFEVAISGNVRQ